jgi:hypothetical protein
MSSKIFKLIEHYSKFREIVVEELSDSTIKQHFTEGKRLAEQIVLEDSEALKILCNNNNVMLSFGKEKDHNYLLEKGFSIAKDEDQDKKEFFFSHWCMYCHVLFYLVDRVITEFDRTLDSYIKYLNAQANSSDRRYAFIDWLKHHQNLLGCAQNICSSATDYWDIFTSLCAEIDDSYNDRPVTSLASGIADFEFLGAIDDLLLRGDYGRRAGFPLIRAALEVMILRRILRSPTEGKFTGKQIEKIAPIKPTVSQILKIIEELQMNKTFLTDCIRRIYDWTSIVAHRGYHTSIPIVWFMSLYTRYEIGSIFDKNNHAVTSEIDKILEKLQKEGLIKIA